MRTESERDRDRVLYSSAFRRLAGVTQVVGTGEVQLFHNRLTHSIKVAQLAQRMAQRILRQAETDPEVARRLGDAGGVDADAAEAVALAHDLGHPPFGHNGERVLDDLCLEHELDGFEGNAQTFRVVTKLSICGPGQRGLNLTRATLNGVLKYPWLRSEDDHTASERGHRWKKWGAYTSERADFEFARETQESEHRTLEAEFMDWADDLTYACHDLEDFYRAGLIPLGRLRLDQDESSSFLAAATSQFMGHDYYVPEEAAKALKWLLDDCLPGSGTYHGTNADRAQLHSMTNQFLDRFVPALRLRGGTGPVTTVDPDAWHEVQILKQLTWHYVIDNPALTTMQEGHARVVRQLFEGLLGWLQKETRRHRLPPRLLEIYDKQCLQDDELHEALDGDTDKMQARAVADYIASLTEVQAADLHDRLHGVHGASIREGWLSG